MVARIPLLWKFAFVLSILFTVNWLGRSWFNYPFLYCWWRPLGEIFTAWSVIVNLVLMVAFALCVALTRWKPAVFLFVAVVFLNAVPQIFYDLVSGACE
jgi:uncharacterized membrane-anchored protein YitT (DUF2179 family)